MRTKIFTFLAETFVHPGIGQNEGAIDLPVAREAATDYPYVPGSGLKGALRDAARGHWPDQPQGGAGSEGANPPAGDAPAPAPDAGQGEPAGPGADPEGAAPESAGEPPAPDATQGEPVALAADPEGAEPESAGARPAVPSKEVDRLFGRTDNAGALLISDLRLILLPVRCLTESYRWLTCPHLLERLHRDQRRATGAEPGWAPPGPPAVRHYLGQGEAQLQLEERTFARAWDIPDPLLSALTAIFPDALAATRLPRQLAIVSDGDFAWFARYGLPVQARNALDPDTKESKALWFEETLPPDTLMYALVSARGDDASGIEQLTQVLGTPAYIQIGGNETVGQGWFRVHSQTGEVVQP